MTKLVNRIIIWKIDSNNVSWLREFVDKVDSDPHYEILFSVEQPSSSTQEPSLPKLGINLRCKIPGGDRGISFFSLNGFEC